MTARRGGRRPRRLLRRLGLAATLGVMVLRVAACETGTDGGRSADGPLQVADAPHGWALAVPPGDVWTDGMETLRFSTDEVVTIDAVELVTDRVGLELVGVQLAGDERAQGSTQFHPTFPPDDEALGPLMPAVGATIDPSPGPSMGSWQLLLGLRLTGAERVVRRGIRIDYSVAGVGYRAVIPAMLAVCPAEAIGPDCEQPAPDDAARTGG